MSVRFDSAACIAAFRSHIIATLLVIQEEYKVLAESHMLTSEGRQDLTSEEIALVGEFIMANVVGGAWAAMDEWGSGSLLDESNPALNDYKNSALWNPLRRDNRIVGRGKGSYTNIFGEQQTSSGNMAGLDLEYLAAQGELQFDIRVQPPSHAMQTAARWMINGRLQTILREAIAAFPWGNFIIAAPD